MRHLLGVLGLCRQSRQHRAKSGYKTALCGGEGSYRGLGVERGGAMLEGVGTVAFRGGGGGTLPHAPDWLDGTRSCLERKQIIQYFYSEAFHSDTHNFRMSDNSKWMDDNGGYGSDDNLPFTLFVFIWLIMNFKHYFFSFSCLMITSINVPLESCYT